MEKNIQNIVELPAIVYKDEKWFVAVCPLNDVASQGKTLEEALYNLREALELYYEDQKEIKLQSPLITHVDIGLKRGVSVSHVHKIASSLSH